MTSTCTLLSFFLSLMEVFYFVKPKALSNNIVFSLCVILLQKNNYFKHILENLSEHRSTTFLLFSYVNQYTAFVISPYYRTSPLSNLSHLLYINTSLNFSDSKFCFQVCCVTTSVKQPKGQTPECHESHTINPCTLRDNVLSTVDRLNLTVQSVTWKLYMILMLILVVQGCDTFPPWQETVELFFLL